MRIVPAARSVTGLASIVLAVAVVAALSSCDRTPAPASTATSAAAAGASAPDAKAAATRIASDVRALSDDAMEGRETGSPGYLRASDLVAQRFAQAGLQPGGDDGTWFQSVQLLSATRLREGAELSIARNGRDIALRFADQYLPALDYDQDAQRVQAPAVFVGQGIDAPELGHDDFTGIDVKGKIAVVFSGAPATFPIDPRAFYSSRAEKLRELESRGAVGAVFVNTIDDESRTPWARAVDAWQRPGMRLSDADGGAVDSFPGLLAVATVSAASADLVFADGPKTAAQLFDAARAGTLKSFDLPGTITIAGNTQVEPAASRNVVGLLRGSDATLAKQHVVLTAHLDHLGVGTAVKGDAIYNGALDNALGVSILIEAARETAAARPAPKRSLLFVALTGEEKGLLGATAFARNAAIPVMRLVANINMDMPMLLVPTSDVVPVGVDHSSLQAVVADAARDIGVTLSPDPYPEENVFVRSDQYAFLRAGIPAVYLSAGVTAVPGGKDPKVAQRDFLRNCYHQPCDDAKQPIEYGDAARLARLNAAIATRVANAAAAPTWNTGDFFGERFGKARDTTTPAGSPAPPARKAAPGAP